MTQTLKSLIWYVIVLPIGQWLISESGTQKNDAVKELKGPDATFYSVFSLEPGADQSAITRAYRKTSLEFHPYKFYIAYSVGLY